VSLDDGRSFLHNVQFIEKLCIERTISHLIGIDERDLPTLVSLNVSLMKELDKQVA
jgi:hypothetical protein